MKTTTLMALAALFIVIPTSLSQEGTLEKPIHVELDKPIQQDTPAKDLESILGHIKKMETIKVGMTRADLEKYFSNRTTLISMGEDKITKEHFRYKECPYIWVDVEISREGEKEQPGDKIMKISKPYLYSVTLQ